MTDKKKPDFKKNQANYRKRQETKGLIYFQKWLPEKLWKDVNKIIKDYQE